MASLCHYFHIPADVKWHIWACLTIWKDIWAPDSFSSEFQASYQQVLWEHPKWPPISSGVQIEEKGFPHLHLVILAFYINSFQQVSRNRIHFILLWHFLLVQAQASSRGLYNVKWRKQIRKRRQRHMQVHHCHVPVQSITAWMGLNHHIIAVIGHELLMWECVWAPTRRLLPLHLL